MQHPSKSRFPLSTKVALAIIVVVGIVAFLYYSPEEFGLENIGNIGSGFNDVFDFDSAVPGVPFNFTMQSSSTPLSQEVKVANGSVSVRGQNVDETSIDNLVFDNEDQTSEFFFEDFQGTVSQSGDTMSIKGTASSVTMDGSKIRGKKERVEISVTLAPLSYSVSPVSISSLKLVGTSGSVAKTDDSSTVNFVATDIEISGFEGSISGTGSSHTISGSASEVESKSFSLKG